MIAKHLQPFFWEVDPAGFEPRLHPEYTILRILEYGDEKAVRWLRETFSASQIASVVRRDRRLSRRSAHFWALIYGIPADEVAALKPQKDQPEFARGPF